MEPILVSCRLGKPQSLLWRGENHAVICVLDHWWEAGRWWDAECAKEFFVVLLHHRRLLLCRNPNSGDWLVKPV